MNDQIQRRIIHVPRRFVADEWGGTETVILEIARRQLAAGWQPEIVTSMALADRRGDEIGGIPVRRFPYCYPFFDLTKEDRAAMDKKGGNLVSWSLFRELWSAKGVRLFHAHALKRLGGEVRTAARLRKLPYVVSLHGGVFDVPAAELASMVGTIENKFEWGKPLGALFGSRRVLEDADHVICVGRGEMELAKRHLSHSRVTYLPNGVDTARFAAGDGAGFRALHGLPADAFVVLCLSRIDPQKNQSLLIDAFARLVAKVPAARLVMIGPETSPEYAAGLRAAAANAGLERRILLLPGLHNDDPRLAGAYHACDVFVLPSRHEPFGIVVLEAWSAGKPVVVSRVGGLRALVEEGRTGLFVNPAGTHAAEDLALAIGKLHAYPAMARRLGENGRDEAQARYDWRQVAAVLEEIYQQAEEHRRQR